MCSKPYNGVDHWVKKLRLGVPLGATDAHGTGRREVAVEVSSGTALVQAEAVQRGTWQCVGVAGLPENAIRQIGALGDGIGALWHSYSAELTVSAGS
jgi:hypothetical protein